MKWRHTSGFSAHNGVQIRRDDEQEKEALAQYIIRSPFSLEKITYKPETGMVVYRSKMTHCRNKANFKVFDALEFIAAITQHIPDKFFQQVIYYGWYSNRSRGERRKEAELKSDIPDSTPVPEEIEALDVSAYKPQRIPPKTWRECIKKVWEVDPLECPKCHAEMKIISFITSSQPNIIRQILEHLGLWEKSRPPPGEPQPFQDVIQEPLDDGWLAMKNPFTP